MFREMFISEFSGTIDNNNFKLKVGEDVLFKYKGEIVSAVIVEIEDGKHGKAIIMVNNPEKQKHQKEYQRGIITHASMLTSAENKTQKIKEIKFLKYV